MNRLERIAGISLAAALLAACTETGPNSRAESQTDICQVTDTTPAIVETETVQVVEIPAIVAEDGTTRMPAVYTTETRPKIVKDRQEITFDAVCEADLTPQFIATLQRALRARGYLATETTGVLDPETRRAVRAYQTEFGLNSDILSIRAAREMGLVV